MNQSSSSLTRRAAEFRGRQAESLVAGWYIERGFRVLAQRLRTGGGELDLVVADDRTVAFVEVKSRARLRQAVEAVTLRQQRRIAAAAVIALATNPAWRRDHTRFDVMLVVGGEVVSIPDAFRPEEA